MSDLFNYLLTGVARGEISQCSTTQMLDARERSWAVPMLKSLGVPSHLLPPLIEPGTILGPVQSGLPLAGTPVIASAGHDTASAVVAVPAEGESWAYLSSGTWSLLGVELGSPRLGEAAYRFNYTNEAGFGETTRLLKNIMGLWLVQECRREFVKQGREQDYATLTTLASEAKPFTSLVRATDGRFLAPGEMPQKIAAFCRETNQSPPEGDGAFIRCCLDSLALEYRRTLDELEEILGRRIDTLHIVGGGSQNELLNQLTADAIGRPVIAGPIEATAIGNLLVQAIGVGAIPSLAEARTIVRASFPVKRYGPRTDVTMAYERYRALVSS